MSKLPLVEGILKYVEEKNIPFSMPGHKYGLGFLSTDIGKELYDNILKTDITEVEGVDNLHNPEGIIRESLELLSRLYGSKKSYFLVNGSTSGNLAMIFSTLNEGDKVIVERNCHRSIFNGIIMRKLKPIYIRNKISKKYNAPMSIDMEHFFNAVEENKDAKAIIITYPNYYGICTDLKSVVARAKKYNMKVLVDSAHGAHFGIHEKLPESALKLGADMVVMSSHKTLASLTQTAYLHVNDTVDIEKVDFYVSGFLSTSPSFMLMCSMDYGRFYLEEHGRQAYESLITMTEVYRKKINELGWLHVLGSEDMEGIDLSRFVISLKDNLSGYKLLDYLRSKKIQCEMSDFRNVVLIFSPFNTESDFEKLYSALSDCNINELRDKIVKIEDIHIPDMKLAPWEAFEKNKIEIHIDKAEGKVCGSTVVPYPPGIPILNIGEVIDAISINMIKYYMEQGVTILGIDQDNMKVVKE